MVNYLANKSDRRKILALAAMTVLLYSLPQLVFASPPPAEEGAISAVVLNLLWLIVVNVFGFFVWVGGSILDIAVKQFVIDFGSLYVTSGLGFAVDNLWGVMRDIFNLTFIFGLVFIGFKMIFNSGSSAKRSLVLLILAALLVNFSLFFTKFVIDFSNIAATQIATKAFAAPAAAGGTPTINSVSQYFAAAMGLPTIFSSERPSAARPSGAGFGYIFGAMIMFCVAAFVFAAGGILLMIRFIVLNFYMILSPFMFIGFVFPSFFSKTTEFWNGFLSRAFFAPAYLLLLYFSYYILLRFTGSGPTPNPNLNRAPLAALFEQNATVASSAMASTFTVFLMTIGFLVASLIIAQKMGAYGAGTAINIGKNLTGRARNAALAGPRYFARTAAGGLANLAERGNNRLESSRTGRNIKRAISVASLGSFTERERLAAIEKARTAKFGGTYSYNDDKKFEKDTNLRRARLNEERDRSSDASDAMNTLKDTAVGANELNTALENLAKTIKAMSAKEKEDFVAERLNDENVALNLTDTDIENLEKSGKFSGGQIQQLKDTRKKAFINVATRGGTIDPAINPSASSAVFTDQQRMSLIKRGPREVGKLPIEVFKQPAMYDVLTPAMVEERMRNGVSQSEISEMKSALQTQLGAQLNNPSNPWVKWQNGNSTYAAQFFK